MNDGPAVGNDAMTEGTAGAVRIRDLTRGRRPMDATLVLADGEVFRGTAFGAEPTDGITTGRFTISTVMSGYQEVISDPDNHGLVVVFSYPQIGNVGVDGTDDEESSGACAGVVVRDMARMASNWRAERDLDSDLRDRGVPGITGVDTRRLVRHLRDRGPMVGSFGTAGSDALLDAARSIGDADGR